MLKWLILGLAMVLVSHWSSKEVHADTPLSENEQALLEQLKRELQEQSDLDKRDESVDSCLEECMGDSDDSDDSDELEYCLEACVVTKRMLAQVREQELQEEEIQGKSLGGENMPSKKILGIRWRRVGDTIRRTYRRAVRTARRYRLWPFG